MTSNLQMPSTKGSMLIMKGLILITMLILALNSLLCPERLQC